MHVACRLANLDRSFQALHLPANGETSRDSMHRWPCAYRVRL